jgi:glycosyltransferase involved in cell wall biosynthesis
MHKYQFYISFNEKINTAASKATQDCKSMLSNAGYQDHSIEDLLPTDKNFHLKLIKRLLLFFVAIKPMSVVAVQYPLLSGNAAFKYFIKAARLKKVRFFCVIHDVDTLRYGQTTGSKAVQSLDVLNHYDCIIAHNRVMAKWLVDSGVSAKIVLLKLFDYLTVRNKLSVHKVSSPADIKTIVFAGNLSKSGFVYALHSIENWHFNLYGPNYLTDKSGGQANVNWMGVLSPDDILTNLNGAFGLVWDGEHTDKLDGTFGNYLKYNNPHKLSLYLAAGLPVIAPVDAAIESFIREHNIGILVKSLDDLRFIDIDNETYETYKSNVLLISDKIKTGAYLSEAIDKVENYLGVGAIDLEASY